MFINSFSHSTVAPNWHVTEKTPPGFSRVYYVHSGEVTYCDQKESHTLKSGYIYIFPSSSAFTISHNPENPLFCTHLHLDIFPYLLHHLIELEAPPESFLGKLFATITESIDQNYHHLLPYLSDALETYCTEKNLFTLPNQEITTVFTYIENHISKEEITVTELSQLLGYNSQYFIRLFKQAVGIPPYQYVINYRMKESMKYLRQDNYTITQIAHLVGYPDLKSFSRAFKYKYGISPSQFRNCTIQIP